MQSLPYRAPEVLLRLTTACGSAMDMWSLGCIVFEMALRLVNPIVWASNEKTALAVIEELLEERVPLRMCAW